MAGSELVGRDGLELFRSMALIDASLSGTPDPLPETIPTASRRPVSFTRQSPVCGRQASLDVLRGMRLSFLPGVAFEAR